MLRKLNRVADLAVVIYEGDKIIAVKHTRSSPWLVWHAKKLAWKEAPREQAHDFELLPLEGHRAN